MRLCDPEGGIYVYIFFFFFFFFLLYIISTYTAGNMFHGCSTGSHCSATEHATSATE